VAGYDILEQADLPQNLAQQFLAGISQQVLAPVSAFRISTPSWAVSNNRRYRVSESFSRAKAC